LNAGAKMNIAGQLIARCLSSLEGHLEVGRCIAQSTGQDSRPPLTITHRWRFTGQNLLSRALIEEHPAFQAFDLHCCRGLLTHHQLRKALDLFQFAIAEARNHGLRFRVGLIRTLLEPVLISDTDMINVQLAGGLWHGLALLATLVGLRECNEFPTFDKLCARLVEHKVLDADIGGMLSSDDLSVVKRGLRRLLNELTIPTIEATRSTSFLT